MISRYPIEELDPEEDDGTMPENVEALTEVVVGHRIVSVERRDYGNETEIVLDNGKRVLLVNTDDCCAYTELETFLLNVEMVDHVIVGVGTTEGYKNWHIYADMGDILKLTVGWSSGNPFYYGYGFTIQVEDASDFFD